MKLTTRIAEAIQAVLQDQADDLARQTGFIQRQRKWTGSTFVQALVFGWLANPESSLSSLNQSAATVGVTISVQGLDQRFTPKAAEFLHSVLAAAVQEVMVGVSVPIPLLERFTGVYVQDSTTVKLPEALAQVWAGCTKAALKIQVRWDLRTGALVQLDLRPGKEHDRRAPMQTEPLPAGALRLADLGYFSIEALWTLDAQEAYFLTRVQVQCLVEDAQGQSWDLVSLLQQQSGNRVDLPIRLGADHRMPCRLLAVRVPPQVAAERRRKLRADAKRRGQQLSQRRLILADWTILVTNVPPEHLSIEEALVLARVRWQIELLFKMWKSHGQIDQWRSEKPWRILCELYAKLIGALIHHWVWILGAWHRPDRSLFQAAHTVQQHAMNLASALASGSLSRLIEVLTILKHCFAAGCRITTRKTRPSTYQLLLACTQESLN